MKERKFEIESMGKRINMKGRVRVWKRRREKEREFEIKTEGAWRDEGKGVKGREKESLFEIEKFKLENEREIMRKRMTIK